MCSHIFNLYSKNNELDDFKIEIVPHFVPQLYPNLRFVLWVQHSLSVIIPPCIERYKPHHHSLFHIARDYLVRENMRKVLIDCEVTLPALPSRSNHSIVSKILLRQDAGNA